MSCLIKIQNILTKKKIEGGALSGGKPRDDGGNGTAVGAWKEHRQRELDRVEREYLVELLRASGGSVTVAGSIAGVSRQRLYAMLRKHGMVRQWRA